MSKRLTTEQFIIKAKLVHGDKYDYSNVQYINNNTKICIICPEHGEFWQTPYSHLQGCGCNLCAEIKRKTTKISKRISYNEAVSKIKKFNINNQNDYISIYETHLQPLKFPKYPNSAYKNEGWVSWGVFLGKERGKGVEFLSYQKAKEYVNSLGLTSPKEWRNACKNGQIPPTIPFYPEKTYLNKGWNDYEEWLGDTYQSRYRECYSYEEAKTILKKYKIQSTTDFFELKRNGTLPHQIPSQPQHYYKEKWIDWSDFLGVKNFAFRDKYGFISMSNQVHKNRYDYSKVEYVNTNTEVTIICPEHGEFKQTPYIHSRGHGCPICNLGFVREYKLSLLKSNDLIHMSSHQLLEVIANKKLPSDFKCLAFSPSGSEERCGSIKELIDLYTDTEQTEEETEQLIETLSEQREQKFNEEHETDDNFVLELDNEESVNENNKETTLPSLLLQGVHSHDNIANLKPSDDAAKFILIDEMHRLWNNILIANENGKLNESIDIIRNEEGGEFWQYVKETFLNEYAEVTSVQTDEEYQFPYQPSLMQKLMVYYLQNNKSFGNWCGTGAGKTNAFLFATRKTKSHVTVAIVPNDVIDTLKNSIAAIYPNSNIIVPQSHAELCSYSEDEYTYIIYNYEKFQGNNGAEETINRLLETNKIDFICLDEVQNVKVRDTDNASSRSQFINNFIVRAREKNSELKTLVMSATPCINNLQEVRSIIELLTGVEHEEIGSRNTIANIHAAYKALLINGFRYVPKYNIEIVERTIDIDCSRDKELYNALVSQDKGDISGIEYILAQKKLDSIKNELKSGTIVYATWVVGMAEMLVSNIKKWGYSVESYNGESGNKEGRKEVLDRFLSGRTDILVCSKPISTGVDGLQKHCNKMVIVSLPWTDADYTQLKGRIYRQGSVFKQVEFVIPQVVINTPNNIEWSWDKMRQRAIEVKKCLGTAVVDGQIQESYSINKERLLSKAIEALESGLEDINIVRKSIEGVVTYTSTERQYSESYINDVHRLANSSHSSTTHNRYLKNREDFKEYHRQREISKSSWIEDPVDRISELINGLSTRYTRVIDLGCGMNKLKTVVDKTRTVQGVDHINVSNDQSVIEADMSNLKEVIQNNSMDVAVFCLSLWGTNYKDYFTEAYRILDSDGKMFIVEPSSKFGEHERYNTIDNFVDEVEKYGFERIGKVENRNNFIYIKLQKI